MNQNMLPVNRYAPIPDESANDVIGQRSQVPGFSQMNV